MEVRLQWLHKCQVQTVSALGQVGVRKEDTGIEPQLCAQCFRHHWWGRVEKQQTFLLSQQTFSWHWTSSWQGLGSSWDGLWKVSTGRKKEQRRKFRKRLGKEQPRLDTLCVSWQVLPAIPSTWSAVMLSISQVEGFLVPLWTPGISRVLGQKSTWN